jgi:hypothetical protein
MFSGIAARVVVESVAIPVTSISAAVGLEAQNGSDGRRVRSRRQGSDGQCFRSLLRVGKCDDEEANGG